MVRLPLRLQVQFTGALGSFKSKPKDQTVLKQIKLDNGVREQINQWLLFFVETLV